jgi:CheY-like chemotaxis protein
MVRGVVVYACEVLVPPVILLVDDEPDLLQLMGTALRRMLPGYEVRCAAGVEQAEEVLCEVEGACAELALVLLDHALGARTGLEVLDGLAHRFPGVPTLMLTGQAPPQVERAAVAHGARVLWKPLPLHSLVGAVQEALA